MKRFNYHSETWHDYLMKLIGKAITAARREDKTQQLYVFRKEDADLVIQMLDMLSTISEYAFLIEVGYVRLN